MDYSYLNIEIMKTILFLTLILLSITGFGQTPVKITQPIRYTKSATFEVSPTVPMPSNDYDAVNLKLLEKYLPVADTVDLADFIVGTEGRVAKFAGDSAVVNSEIYTNGVNVGIGIPATSKRFTVGAKAPELPVTITGTGNPSPNGNYEYKGQMNGANYYQRGTDGWYIFFASGAWWLWTDLDWHSGSGYYISGTVPRPREYYEWNNNPGYTGTVASSYIEQNIPQFNVDSIGNVEVGGTLTISGAVQGRTVLQAVNSSLTHTVTLPDTTGTLALLSDIEGLHAVRGDGSAGYIPKWTNGTTLGNSNLYLSGENVGIGTPTPTKLLSVGGTSFASPIVITGNGNPSPNGTYSITGQYNGANLYRRGADNFWIFQEGTAWWIYDRPGWAPDGNGWLMSGSRPIPTASGGYDAAGSYTGVSTLGFAETSTGRQFTADETGNIEVGGVIEVSGVTSGVATIRAADVANTPVITLPDKSGTLALLSDIENDPALNNDPVERVGTTDITGSNVGGAQIISDLTITCTPKGHHILVFFSAPFTVTANDQNVTVTLLIGGDPVRTSKLNIFSNTQNMSFQHLQSVIPNEEISVEIAWFCSGNQVFQNGASMSERILTVIDLP